MNRRKLLLGMGTTAAGAGVVFGSGAFTQVQADRDITVRIDDDSAALIGLEAGDDVASVFENEDGELEIDTDEIADGGEGFAVGSTVTIEDAFTLTNNFDDVGDDSGEIDVAVDLLDFEDEDATLEFTGDGGSTGEITIEGGQRRVFEDVGSGEEITFDIEITTDSTANPEDLDGDVVFQAGDGLTSEDFPTEEPTVTLLDDDDNEDSTFVTIGAALDGADTDYTVEVGDGVYNEQVTIDVEGLTLEAAEGASPTVTQDSGTVVDVNADGVTADGLTVEAGNGTTAVNLDGVSDGAAVTLTDNTIDLTAGDADSVGINTGSGSGISETIADNTFEGLVFDTEVQEFVDNSENRVDRAGIVSLTNDNTFEPDVIGSVTNLITAVPQEDADVVSSDTEFATFLDDSVQKADDNSGASFAARVKPTESYTNSLDGEGSDTVAGISTFGDFFRIDISGVNTDNTYSHPDGPSISAAVVGGSGTVTHQNAVRESQGEVFLFVPQSTTSGEDITIALGNFEQGSSDWSNLDVESDDFVTVHIEDVST